MTVPDVAVVIPTYRRPGLLEGVVRALEQQTIDPSRYEVLIVDDASDDDTAATLQDLAARTTVDLRPVIAERNGGPASARNIGWRASSAPIIAFTDDDCVVEPGWLEHGLRQMELQPAVGILQGRTLRPTEPYDETAHTVAREILQPSAWFEGCNLFIRREALEAVGGFDDSINLPWGEDTELGWAILEAGYERGYDQDAIVRHELAERSLKWHLKFSYREAHLVRIARAHPRLRTEGFWRPWSVHPHSALFVLGAAGTVGAVRWRPLLVLWLPWLWFRRPSRYPFHPYPLRLAERWLLDLAAFTGMKVAAVRYRRFII